MPKGENPVSRKNLQPNAAEDKPGPGRSIGVWLPEEQILALDALEGSRAVHIRRAIALYLAQFTGQ